MTNEIAQLNTSPANMGTICQALFIKPLQNKPYFTKKEKVNSIQARGNSH